MRGLCAEFRQIILRGNVVDLAAGIVIGAAFTGVVQGFPSLPVGAVTGDEDLPQLFHGDPAESDAVPELHQ
jgi:large-conductance mechanosensitive channel